MSTDQKPLYRDINADDEDPEITEIESLCVACEENGTTKLLLTKIPFFKEVIIMSFECPHCGNKNNEIQPGSMVQEKGNRITLKVNNRKMLNRQVVKQASAMYRIEDIDFEAPAFGSKAVLTTIEGLLDAAIDGLQDQQPVRKIMQPEIAQKIDKTIEHLEKYKTNDTSFTFVLEDISGNSFIENPYAPEKDSDLTEEFFVRTKEHNEMLGLTEEPEEIKEKDEEQNLKKEVLEFPTNCSSCQSPTKTKMKIVQIPHFKEIIVMGTDCDVCGYKTNEVKAGGATEPLGTKITFKLTDLTDLNRDVLTSETCCVSIPDLDLELNHASMAGKFTTIEGLLTQMKEQLGKIGVFATGDSASKKNKMKETLRKIDQVIAGEMFVTLLLDDPVGNSFIQNTYAPDPDPELIVEKYERTTEQNDELGISHMVTEGYA